MSFFITIKKEVQTRHCKVAVQADGTAVVTVYADEITHQQREPYPSLAHAREHCEDVQLGGVVNWQREGSAWLSDSVLTDTGGTRLTPAECELARKALAKKGNHPGLTARLQKQR
jgi:hypothetical protein